MHPYEISNYWRLCDSLSIKQAALLIMGIDPESEIGTYCEGWKPHERPKGYGAVTQALTASLLSALIKGKHFCLSETDINGNFIGEIPGTTDIDRSTMGSGSITAWLKGQGVKTGFFFPMATDTPDYLDPGHPRYAPKLAAAVRVWQAMEDENLRKTGKPIADMTAWLESRYKEFGLVHKQGGKNTRGEATHKVGDRNGGAITQVSQVANWEGEGRAPTTPSA